MGQLLKPGQILRAEVSGLTCKVKRFLGDGTQGEVHHVEMDGTSMALKWYFQEYLAVDDRLKERLEMAVKRGTPSDRFLWPLELVSTPGEQSFGYLMKMREPRFKSIIDMMKRRVEPSFRAVVTAGFELAHSYFLLHSKGLCYRDISFGNVFFDPETGEVRICDNDNVDIDGQAGPIRGTPRFMAPEIVRNEAAPSTRTDLFSLAVLLFHLLMMHHPLEGKKEAMIHSLDPSSMFKLYGTEALFIFDPHDDSNRPLEGYHDNAIVFWPLYPQFVRDLFTRAFTNGIRNPEHGRVRESEWRSAMISLRDLILYCPNCRTENFARTDEEKRTATAPLRCWACRQEIMAPLCLLINRKPIMLNYDTSLFGHHIDINRPFDFTEAAAVVSRHPRDPGIWGLQNCSREKWVATTPEGQIREIGPGRSIAMVLGLKINFGNTEGEIRA